MNDRAISSFAVTAVLSAALAVGGCGSVTQEGSILNTALTGTANPPPAIDLDKFGPKVKCPPLRILPGTESLSVYEGKEVSAFSVQYQATISDTASECHVAGGMMTFKIGVRGRLLAGPKRPPGALSVPLPLRIAVTRDGDSVIYSQVHEVPVGLAEAETTKPWAQVVESIQVPDEGTLRVLVGFDDEKDGERS